MYIIHMHTITVTHTHIQMFPHVPTLECMHIRHTLTCIHTLAHTQTHTPISVDMHCRPLSCPALEHCRLEPPRPLPQDMEDLAWVMPAPPHTWGSAGLKGCKAGVKLGDPQRSAPTAQRLGRDVSGHRGLQPLLSPRAHMGTAQQQHTGRACPQGEGGRSYPAQHE